MFVNESGAKWAPQINQGDSKAALKRLAFIKHANWHHLPRCFNSTQWQCKAVEPTTQQGTHNMTSGKSINLKQLAAI